MQPRCLQSDFKRRSHSEERFDFALDQLECVLARLKTERVQDDTKTAKTSPGAFQGLPCAICKGNILEPANLVVNSKHLPAHYACLMDEQSEREIMSLI